ncbi:hypothetical protein [Sanyastnella coralliicola]|uniref:hypothetical protein n=1 Tax=Sanyastnella coralliicola TaxID=3069118 RepID=UPI0027B9F3C5|nr:hypothetical protein [Longitalea sp. SCSIO 12813]
MKLKLKKPGAYFMELLILIAGITISFMLNEWRTSRTMSDEQARIIAQLKTDLQRDTALAHQQLKFMEQTREAAISLLKSEEPKPLGDYRSDIAIMVNTVSQRFASSTFIELESTGKLGLIEDDNLRGRLISYYTAAQPAIYEWHEIDKSQYLPMITNYMNTSVPFSLNYNFAAFSPEDSVKFIQSIQADEFKHIVQFNVIIKSGVGMHCQALLSEAEALLQAIE